MSAAREILDALLEESEKIGREIAAAHRAYLDDADPASLRRWDDALARQRGMSRAIRIVIERIAGVTEDGTT